MADSEGPAAKALAERIEAELVRARTARLQGNAGMARVCARRAAGLAIREWYRKRSRSGWGGDALKQLQRLQADALAPEAIRAAARRLATKVDMDHRLPFEEDPIEDARGIIEHLSDDMG
jgi:hypothetical protein